MDALHRLDGYDELKTLLDTTDEGVLDRLDGPTLTRIPGTGGGGRARLVSCLLHGNEDSGYRAVLDLLRSGARFPFDLWVLIGNVTAATTDGWFAHRYLDGQEDFNRVWGLPGDTPQRRAAAEVLDVMREEPLEAALDLHNTTGRNPSHAIVPDGSPGGDAVAAACSDLVLRWRLGAHTLMEELTPHCPSIAVECGVAGSRVSRQVADRVLHRFLSCDDFVDVAAHHETRVFEMEARVVVRPDVAFVFGPMADDVDLALYPDLDRHNFDTLPAGTRLGTVKDGRMPLQASDMDGADVTEAAFVVDGEGALSLARDVVPVMMTRTVTQTRRDCFFYIAGRR
jgi:hypothetical protein